MAQAAVRNCILFMEDIAYPHYIRNSREYNGDAISTTPTGRETLEMKDRVSHVGE